MLLLRQLNLLKAAEEMLLTSDLWLKSKGRRRHRLVWPVGGGPEKTQIAAEVPLFSASHHSVVVWGCLLVEG